MTTIEIIIAAIGGQSTLTAAGVGMWKLVQRWQVGKERVRLAEIAANEREDEREATTVRELFAIHKRTQDRLAKVELHSEQCHEALASQSSLNQTLIASNADCEKRDAARKREIAELRRKVEDTGRFEVGVEKALAKRSTPLPPPLKRSSRDDMEPKE